MLVRAFWDLSYSSGFVGPGKSKNESGDAILAGNQYSASGAHAVSACADSSSLTQPPFPVLRCVIHKAPHQPGRAGASPEQLMFSIPIPPELNVDGNFHTAKESVIVGPVLWQGCIDHSPAKLELSLISPVSKYYM